MSLLGDPMAVALFQAYTNATGASNVGIAAVAGYQIRVLSYTFNAAGGENDVTFQSNTTALSGAFELANNATVHATCMAGLFESAVGEQLSVLQSAATLCVAHFTYVLIPDLTLNETG